MGSQEFMALVGFSLIASQVFFLLSSWMLLHLFNAVETMNACTVGFSGVLFALKYVLSRRSPGVTSVSARSSYSYFWIADATFFSSVVELEVLFYLSFDTFSKVMSIFPHLQFILNSGCRHCAIKPARPCGRYYRVAEMNSIMMALKRILYNISDSS